MRAARRTFPAKESQGKLLGTLVCPTVAFAVSRGISIERIEAETGATAVDLINPDARLPAQTAPRIWLLLAEQRAAEVPLSIEMARATPFSFLGHIAFAAQFATDLHAALGLLVRNRVVVADLAHIDLVHADDEVAFEASHPLDMLDGGRTLELSFAVLWRLVAELLDLDQSLKRVELSHPPFGAAAAYVDFFRVPVLFDQPRNALVFHTTALSAPIPKANIGLFSYVDAHFDQIRKRIEREHGPDELQSLRRAIVELSTHGDFRADAVAAHAGLSLRSAQRMAAANGVSLQAMITEIRAANAIELLDDPRYDIASIAHLVGYSDDRAFRRAFKRWTGTTPSDHRGRRWDEKDGVGR